MRKNSRSVWRSGILSILLSAGIGLSAAVLCTLVFSVLIRFLLKDMGLANVFAYTSVIVGAFVGAYICGRYRRHRGIIFGVLCGVTMFLVLMTCGVMIGGDMTGVRKLVMMVVAGGIGGVYGVNSKRPKNCDN
ncbi:MAG: TIGR04086 family membrane protein [Ruminococcus sp.]|nr:TIGR04086 family membrane protein [Ruminococcus sp.]